MGVYALKNQFAPFSVPGYTAFYALFFLTGRETAGGSPEWGFELVAHPAHEVRELAVCPLSFAAEPFRCPGAFPVQHGAKAQPFKQRLCHHSDGPAAVILALVILHTGLGHFHESGFFEDGDRPLTTALTDAGIPHDGAHINVDKAAGERRSAQTHRSKVKVGQDCFQDDLTGLTAFRAGTSVRVRLQGRAFLWMVEPCLCPLCGQRQNTR